MIFVADKRGSTGAGYLACTGGKINWYRLLVGEFERGHFWDKRGWENANDAEVKGIELEDVECIYVACGWNNWWAVVSMIMNFRVSKKLGIVWNSWRIITFRRRVI